MKNKNKKIVGVCIGILSVVLLVITSTYAYWQITKTQEGRNDIIAACLDIDMQSVDGTFGLDPAWPLSDDEGEKLKGYTFKVTNNCEEDVNYLIGMDSLDIDGEHLSYESIKVLIDSEEPVIFKTMDKIEHIEENDSYTIRESKKINTAVVYGNTSNTHNVKVWIKEDAPVEEQSKVFRGRIFITGGQKIDNDKPLAQVTPEECFEMNGNEIIDYKEENSKCGTSVVLPATVNGVQVKTIDSNAFKKEQINTLFKDSEYAPVDSIDISNVDFSYVCSGFTVEDFCLPEYIIIRNNSQIINEIIDADLGEIVSDEPIEKYVIGDEMIPEFTIGKTEIYIDILDGSTLTDYDATIVGFKEATNKKLLNITGLDLSLATNLEKIEEIAFSEWELIDSEENGCVYKNPDILTSVNEGVIPKGLNYLKLGDQKELLIGTGAFGSLTTDELTIYTNLKAYSNCYDEDGFALAAPFVYSNINTLNIEAINNDTIFDLNAEAGLGFSSFNDINIKEGITEMGKATFSLTAINSSLLLPNSLEIINSNAFAFTNGKEDITVTIPDNVKYIGDNAFRWWKNTTTIKFTRTEAEVKNQVTLGNNWNHNSQVIYAES